ncbi:MAG TPA: zf-HC2 domain-containing protein [Thermoanaerobaculia bacterium]|nr:zf-HC2 domain-containing protein [Thermoanaerobaculia bacterium]
MTCDQANELLPWLLNGTLGEDERQALREHLAGCASCREALAETRFAWQVFDQHLAPETLVALAYGDAPPDGLDPALAERHLAACPRCAAEMELVRTSRQLEEDDRVVPLARPARPATAGVAAPRPSAGSRAWRSSALAAGLAGLVALGGWIHTANQLAERGAPQINVAYPSGQASEGAERSGEAPVAARIQADRPASLSLPAEHEETHGAGEHAIAILDASDRVVWSARGLVRDSGNDDYTVNVPKGFLKPGSYNIRITAQEGGREVVTETYAVQVD